MSECTYCRSVVVGDSLFCCQSCELLSNWIAFGVSPIKTQAAAVSKWQKYNIPELEAEFNLSVCPVYKKFSFYVEGLQCSSCVHLLEDLPQYRSEVMTSRLDYSRCILEVETKSTFALGFLCEVIADLGYTPSPLKEKTDYEKAAKIENRNDLKRIGVAGAVAANEMLFSIPLYAGLVGELGYIFKWISFVIFLPLVFYAAIPFYKKAWASLLVRRVNVDLMIVAAFWCGFIFSSYSLLLGAGELYFDSTAGFIFLILLTRYFLRRHNDKLIRRNIFTDLFVNDVYKILAANKISHLPFNKIQSNQRVQLEQNQLAPCDAILSSDACEVDLSFLTGEAYPHKKHKGDVILAGSRLLSTTAIIESQSEAHQSRLAQSLDKINSHNTVKNSFQTMTDIMAHRLTLVVFTIAGLFFILTYQYLGFEAFKRCLALITIACPCAVAFGTPLAHNIGLRKAGQRGFFIKSEGVFEKLSQIKKIIFDKTGTLTSAQLKLVKTLPADISQENKSIILGIEKFSMHPVALSLKNIWSDSEIKNILLINEIAGAGVMAIYNGNTYRLVKSKSDLGEDAIQVDFSLDDRQIARLFFEEDIVPEAGSVIEKFYEMGYDIMLLSGDKKARAIKVAKKLGIRPSHVFAEQSAQSKKLVVAQQAPCLFVGDGLNDLPALHTAHVSFAIKGAFESTLQASDIYAPKKDLHSILEIFGLAKKINRTVQTNLLFAVFYNSVGGILALSGMINPLTAAILMPASSFLITLHTVWRLK